MNKYIFILGNNPALSRAEIMAVLPNINIIASSDDFLVVESDDFNCQEILDRLGGTIKVGKIFDSNTDNLKQEVIQELTSRDTDKKIKFGFSLYDVKIDKNLGMEIKHELKDKGINSRLVISKEKALSSVIVKKEKCIDFLILPEYIGVTCAVQDFKEYGHRDFGRPASDSLSGMLPPKLAKMMINISKAKYDDVLFDPFCGSGTVLAEALSMGFGDVIGSDSSKKAVEDSRENLQWLAEEFKIQNSKFNIFVQDVRSSFDQVKEVNVIVTEPFLGSPIKGSETDGTVSRIKKEVEELYIKAFEQYKKVLSSDGRVVMVFPQWHLRDQIWYINIEKEIKDLGFQREDNGKLIYKRDNQKVWREIHVYSV